MIDKGKASNIFRVEKKQKQKKKQKKRNGKKSARFK